MTSPATYRCTACGREFGATSPAVVFGVHGVGPRSRLTCTGGSLVPVGQVTLPIARDDRAGVTLPTAIQPVGGDQLEPGRAGQVEGAAGADVVEQERSRP